MWHCREKKHKQSQSKVFHPLIFLMRLQGQVNLHKDNFIFGTEGPLNPKGKELTQTFNVG